MLRRLPIVNVLVLAALAAACAPAAPAATPEPARPEVLHMEIPGDPDVTDLPWLMAVETLRDEGYLVETVSLDDVALPSLALEEGDVDFATVSNVAGWSAIAEGASIVTLMDKSANLFIVIAAPEVRTCADLDGQRVAVASLNAVPAAMLITFIGRNCPEAEPEYLIMAGGSNRRAALMAGEAAAAILDVDDLIRLQAEGHEELHPLLFLGQEFPGLTTTSVFTRRSLAQEYPDTVHDVLRTLLEARRRLQDPAVLSDEIVAQLGMEAAEAQTTSRYYLEQKSWDLNGRYTPTVVQANIDFLVAAESLPAGLKAETVADLSFLNHVLDEIGRQ